MKLTQLLVAGAAFVSFGAVAADEPKQKQDSQAQGSQSQQGGEKQAQSGQMQQKQQMSQRHSPEVVKQVQEKLSSQGYDPGPVDGKMGPKTQQAVKKLQEDRSLQASGQLDQQTLATLGLDQAGSASTGASGSASGGQSSQPQSKPQSSQRQPSQPQSSEKPSTEKKY